nr:hypothetical protein [Tanacetum cinerariifolium]
MKSGSKTLYFYLANWRVQSLRVTIWGGLGDVLVERKTKHVGMCAVVLTIMSANSSTVIYNDDDIPSLQELKTKIDSSLAKEGTLENLLIWARNRQNNQPSTVRKGVTRQPRKWLCEACNKIFDYPVFRYRFEVVVADDTAHIVVVMFDDTTTKFVKCSTESLMAADDEGADANDDSNFPTTIRNLIGGAYLKCNSRAENSFIYDPNSESFNEVQRIFNPPPQPHYNIYLFQLCESNSHYGYECLQRVLLVYEPEPCYNKNFGDNAYPHASPGVTPLIDHHCCYKCRDSLDDLFCHQCTCEFCRNGAHDGYNCPSHVNSTGNDETDCDPEEEIRLIEKLLYDNSSPRSPEEFIFEKSDVAIESFSVFHILVEDSDSVMEEIDLTFTPDDSMPLGIENDDYDSDVDMFILEELLSNDSLSLPENESFDFDIPSSPRPPAKPPDDDEIKPNSGMLIVKVVGDISEQYVPMPRFLPTQPTLTSNQEKSHHLLSHRGLKAFKLSSECPMMIYGGNTPILDVPFLHFYPP